MKLKSLEVQGFKTFPDKTKLEFTSGITAVVGPNGSGKSNISDAIRWVLGEQSAKALRCSRMEDVIFNGTQQRKRTGYAQVTLSFDNADRALKFDGDEVAVTRRYYRSGNSEYLINNTAVRLQDIHELFMDTGLGRDGYSMIGQGKIDAIVGAKSEDRREIFEEAAGISRFRYKKAEAERRLERTEDNLVRLRDIVTGLEERVEPLRIQSEKAKSYLVFAEEKRGLEIALWLRSLDRSAAAVREQEDKLTVAQLQYNETMEQLSAIQQDTEQGYQKQNEYNAKADELRRTISDKEDRISAASGQAAVLHSDVKHNEETIQRIRGSIEELSLSDQQLIARTAEKETQAKGLQEQLAELTAERTRLTEELLRLRTGESNSADQLSELNRELTQLTADAGDAKVAYMTASTALRELTERSSVIENTVKAKHSQIETLEKIIEEYRSMCGDCDEKTGILSDRRQQLRQEIAGQEKTCAELRAKAEKADLHSRQISGKAKMLEDLERNLEGFTHSVKLVMRASGQGQLSGIHGPVSRVIRTPSQYRIAIETALGGAMQNIVTTGDADAKKAIAYLKQHDGGRATFLPMSAVKGRELNEKGLEQCEGFVGIASELCSCEEQYRGILLNLLGRIVVADDLDHAFSIARSYGFRFRVVTIDGQVVNAGGSLTGGSLAKNTGLLGRADEIEQLKQEAAAEKEKAGKHYQQLESQQELLQALQQKLQDCADEMAVVSGDKVKLEAEIRSRSTELESTRQALQEAKKEQSAAKLKSGELNSTIEVSRKELESLRSTIAEKEAALRRITGSKDELVKEREQLNDQLQELRMKMIGIEKDVDAIRAEIRSAQQQRQMTAERIRISREEIASLEQNSITTAQQAEVLEQEAAGTAEEVRQLRLEIEEIGRKKLELEKNATEYRRKERELTEEKERLSGELARLEERRSNLQKSYDDIMAKLWDEYELTKREAEQYAVKIEDQGKAQRRLSELKQKIKALGNVNVASIEEYKEVSEKYEFMKAQVGDVERSKAELTRLITDLVGQMRRIFVDRFALINQNFGETFRELFGGGKASLSLSDPENVLTTGIDITVEPPGKIVSHIELLSGGEKALVAIALYFAIMKVSPAPFCVMDEIEAALDDVNVYRFAEYLRRMNDRTQFICITHRRGTMEEADVLYGVTMQDRGISKLLELRASEVAQKLQLEN